MKRENGYEKVIFKENCKFCFCLLICFSICAVRIKSVQAEDENKIEALKL